MSTITTHSTVDTIDRASTEMSATHKERLSVIKGLWVALIARQHLLMLGPGGTGKSFLVRDLASRITDAVYFDVALDETSDPGEVFGPVDIKAMKEDGKQRRRVDGMLPEADIAFIDEFMNANGPTRHAMMPPLNERIYHNNGKPTPIPLWSAFMGTNKLDADVDQAAVFDRIHQRHVLHYVRSRDNIRDMVTDSIERRILAYQQPARASISLADLRAAHDQAMQLPVSESAWECFLDLKEELLHDGIEVGSRRIAEGMAAVLANAWLNGHSEVAVADLDILQHMWWILQRDIDQVQKLVLGATNPGEKAAMDLLDELETYKADFRSAQDKDLDDTKKRLVGMEIYKNSKKIIAESEELEEKAIASDASTVRIRELREQAEALMNQVSGEFFDL